MKQMILFFLAAVIGATMLGCNNSDKPDETAKTDTTTKKANLENAKVSSNSQMKQVGDGAEGVIATKTWDPISEEWNSGTRKEFSKTINFKLGITVEFKFTTLTKDSANSMVEKVTVTLTKANKSYGVTAAISEQYNMGTEDTIFSYVMTDITATLKPNAHSSTNAEAHWVHSYSKDGTIDVDK